MTDLISLYLTVFFCTLLFGCAIGVIAAHFIEKREKKHIAKWERKHCTCSNEKCEICYPGKV